MLRQKILAEEERSRTDFLSQKTFVFFSLEKGIGDKSKKARKHQKKNEKKVFPL